MHYKKIFSSTLKRIIPVIAFALAPSAALAGVIQTLHNTLLNSPPPTTEPVKPETGSKPENILVFKTEAKTVAQIVKGPATIGLNEKGDMTIKRGDVSVTMAYNAPEDRIEPKERVNVAQSQWQDTSTINGISLKVALVF